MTLEDAPAIAELLLASDIAVLGHSDYTLTELEADLRRSDLEHTGWYDESGDPDRLRLGRPRPSRPARSSSTPMCIPSTTARSATRCSPPWRRAAWSSPPRPDTTTRSSTPPPTARTSAPAAGSPAAASRWATTFTRMRIDFAGPQPAPEPPTGVVVRRSDAADDDLRLALDIHEKAFTEHYGHVPRTFEKFREQFHEHGPTGRRSGSAMSTASRPAC